MPTPIYFDGSYAVYRGRDGHIITDVRQPFVDCHAHGIRSLKVAKRIIHNVRHSKRPDTHNLWLLRSHFRLTQCPTYRRLIEDLITARREHRQPTIRRPR